MCAQCAHGQGDLKGCLTKAILRQQKSGKISIPRIRFLERIAHVSRILSIRRSCPRAFLVTLASAIVNAAMFSLPLTAENPRIRVTQNESGLATTLAAGAPIDPSNPFFQSLGTNGRACVHCHQPDAAWSITPAGLQKVFQQTRGLDPVFRTNDGSNSPLTDVSTVDKRRAAYSMLLNKGVIRVGLPIPAQAEFELSSVDDPYQFASAKELSLFRRPLPGTNIRFISAVMWDGRDTFQPVQNADSLRSNLQKQALDATLGHAQASAAPTQAQLESIANLIMGLHTAQVWDRSAGSLRARGARGGAETLLNQDFYIGINDPIGMNPKGVPFDSSAMQMFPAWTKLHGQSNDLEDLTDRQDRNDARASVARGERIFNSRPIVLSGVGGLNDALNVPNLQGTCTTCHDTPNVGNHSVSMPLNIGISDESRRTPDMPLYTLRNKQTGAVIKTTDPGRALISGKWADVGKFKGPVLRALAARPPYFHNGSAADLGEVVDFYNTRFTLNLTAREKEDLIAFLRVL